LVTLPQQPPPLKKFGPYPHAFLGSLFVPNSVIENNLIELIFIIMENVATTPNDRAQQQAIKDYKQAYSKPIVKEIMVMREEVETTITLPNCYDFDRFSRILR
jgi:hypothetical protein